MVTCGLTACTPGSAPGPTLGIEYGKAFTFSLFYCAMYDSRAQWYAYTHTSSFTVDCRFRFTPCQRL